MRRAQSPVLLLSSLLALSGCEPAAPPDGDDGVDDDDSTNDDDDDDDSTNDDDDDSFSGDGPTLLQVGPDCAAPSSGLDRFTDRASELGVSTTLDGPPLETLPWSNGVGARILVEDGDGDGDLDLIFGNLETAPVVYRNDGGTFSEVLGAVSFPPEVTYTEAFLLVDLNGDSLPELLASTKRQGVLVLHNAGDLQFEAAETLFLDPANPEMIVTQLDAADLDRDGDVDLLLGTGGTAGLDPDPDAVQGAPDTVLLMSDGAVEQSIQLPGAAPGSNVLAASISDFDRDGWPDLLLPTDGSRPSELFQGLGVEDGLPTFADVAPATGADLIMRAMGLDAADLNEDGRPDYCISDTGPPRCLVSLCTDSLVESALAMGISDSPDSDDPVVGWGIDFADLDNDGWVDLVQASGPANEDIEDGGPAPSMVQPDRWWAGSEDGFTDVSAAIGLDDADNHLSVVSADLNGDGALDVVLAGPHEVPHLLMGECTAGSWLELDLVGPAGNARGLGAVVVASSPNLTWTQDVHSAVGPGQQPARLHFGLGELDAVDLEVTWPDGSVSRASELATNRVYSWSWVAP